ncbi:hypothetical protein MMPV_002602 [Pyropia vietnamensis]
MAPPPPAVAFATPLPMVTAATARRGGGLAAAASAFTPPAAAVVGRGRCHHAAASGAAAAAAAAAAGSAAATSLCMTAGSPVPLSEAAGCSVLGADANGAAWRVHKFGGSSLANAACFRNVASILRAEAKQVSTHKLFVVVSAVGGVTDSLEALVKAARDRSSGSHYLEGLDALREQHERLADELLQPGVRASFLASLSSSLRDIRDLLRAAWIARSASERISELVIGHGELWSAQLLWGVLRQGGDDSVAAAVGAAVAGAKSAPCSWLDARDVLVASPSLGRSVRRVVDWDSSRNKLMEWTRSNPTVLVVATGFICADPDGVPTTLGRDGSDYSASSFARLLCASEVTIWTDVAGVYSADPRVVRDAVVIPRLTYKEAAELAYFGARVLHPDTMTPAIDMGIPLRIRSTLDPEAAGTYVTAVVEGEAAAQADEAVSPRVSSSAVARSREMSGVKGFSTISDVSLINLEGTGMIGVPGIASTLFSALSSAGISVILIAQASSEFSLCVAVPGIDGETALTVVRRAFRAELAERLISSVELLSHCSILAMVGERMQHQPGMSARLFASLSKAGVNIRAISQGSSENNISVVVARSDEQRAVRACHSAFYLSDQTLSVGVIGTGLVGGTLLEQIQSQAASLRADFGVDIRVRGLATSRKMLLAPDALDLDSWADELATEGATVPLDLDAFSDHIRDATLPHAVIFDCTASEALSPYYPRWLAAGIHIITPNKKANSDTTAMYTAIRDAQQRLNTHFFYEANVGAGLPIISTIRDLLRTGDTFTRIEGVFSGTLSYIFNEFTPDTTFSSIVSRAASEGFTEPDPRDDLAGTDVARKVVILAREIGITVELADVSVKSLVPDELADTAIVSVDEFTRRLPDFDAALTEMAAEAATAGELLRYVGVIDVPAQKCTVELRRYRADHPFGRLQGSDNIVSFRTRRYDAQPLVIQGPGAGAAVTAAGVFADLLRLAAHLGAPSTAEM